ncbi:UvrB/UvrC motif-containing protein [Listeria ilorinensis]|uniref:UvrB/UvrC motif-containing protein n=1 Tax=Listeria ilorinensis TaxID=2867439 RepID=UPI001EF5A4BA|nr:UvrB/UvrC motif-containing protein [Listeria ilorinensis]
MLCQKCGEQEATMEIQQVSQDGTMESLYICENCAAEISSLEDEVAKAMDTFNGIALDFLTLLQQGGKLQTEQGVVCEHCGLSFDDFLAHNRVGCEHCYQAFQKQLLPMIGRVQNNHVRHIGKMPARFEEAVNRQQEIQALRDQIQQAIESEAFEEAAVLRDKIKALEGGAE